MIPDHGRLVVFDVETGGLDPQRHPVIQFAAVAVDAGWNELEAFECKVVFDPTDCAPEALDVNGYTPERWRDAIAAPLARWHIAEFLSRHATVEKRAKRSGRSYLVARLCGHNSRFDGDFLAAWFKQNDEFLPAACFETLDTLALARWLTLLAQPPGPKDHKLASLCEWLGIELNDAHDALADVRATAELARRFYALLLPAAEHLTVPAEVPGRA